MFVILKFRDNKRSFVTLEVKIEERVNNQKTVDLKDIDKYNILSISGDMKELTNGRGRPRRSCSGQIYDEISTKNRSKLRLIEIWKRWHLNDMKSGTKKQNECLDNWKDRPEGWSYKENCNYLKKHHLYNNRGYRYGSARLVEILPKDIIEEIELLCSKINKSRY